jgi:hypothetical protein
LQNYVDNGSGFDYFRGETKNDMTTTEHLQRIKSECELCLEISSMANSQGRAEAGWRSTIAAIDWLIEIDATHLPLATAILATWPIELLTQ